MTKLQQIETRLDAIEYALEDVPHNRRCLDIIGHEVQKLRAEGNHSYAHGCTHYLRAFGLSLDVIGSALEDLPFHRERIETISNEVKEIRKKLMELK